MIRRSLNFGAACLIISPILIGCAEKEKAKIVYLDSNKIKNLDDLVREIKIGASDRLPSNIEVHEIYRKLADAFVEYSKDALQAGIEIPNIIRDKLPKRKKVIVPAMMIFTLWGVKFIVPISTFFNAILGSLAVMSVFILTAINSALAKPNPSV